MSRQDLWPLSLVLSSPSSLLLLLEGEGRGGEGRGGEQGRQEKAPDSLLRSLQLTYPPNFIPPLLEPESNYMINRISQDHVWDLHIQYLRRKVLVVPTPRPNSANKVSHISPSTSPFWDIKVALKCYRTVLVSPRPTKVFHPLAVCWLTHEGLAKLALQLIN